MKALSKLAPAFNMLMGITPGFFGSSPRSSEPGAGEKRARDRLTAHRNTQAERLKDAEPPVVTRQQRRAEQRKQEKQLRLTPAQTAFVHRTGKRPTYPKATFVNRF